MEIGRYTLRQSILCWKVVKMWVRIGATYLLFTALTEKNVRIDTAQHQEIFMMTDISSCRPILTPIARTDLDLLIYFFLKPSGAAKSVENFDVRQSRSDNLTCQYYFAAFWSENHLWYESRVPWLMFRKASSWLNDTYFESSASKISMTRRISKML